MAEVRISRGWIELFGGITLFVLGGMVGGPLGDLGSYVWSSIWGEIDPPIEQVKIDFQDVQGCPGGELTAIRKRFEDPQTALTNGADRLTICDSEALQTTRPGITRDLANRFPGCLIWGGDGDSRGLMMVRKSDAVCALPSSVGYVCDGANARHALGQQAIGEAGDVVRNCDAALLRRFGFTS
jgi:hypothetical protein